MMSEELERRDAAEIEAVEGEALEEAPAAGDRMRELEGEMAEVAAEVERLTTAPATAQSSGTDLVHIGQSAPQVKKELARRAQSIADLQERGKAIAAAMKEEMERRTREAMEVISPLKAMIKQLEEGIWTVNLYLGRDEQITTLRKGEPAPQGTPIQIRQLVLSMDEETAITEGQGLDFRDVDLFDEWLLADPAHLDQVLPETKGIVAIRPRAEEAKEEGFWRREAEERDKHTYFLIRNGEGLYRLWTDFSIGDRMVPDAAEFERLFRDRKHNWDTGERDEYTLEPGDHGYDEAAERAAYRERDYTRMGLILQGLAERTAVFHPLPAEGLNFLDGSSEQRGDVIFVRDAERTMGKGDEDFDSWLRRVNGELQVGMRIVGTFHGYGGDFHRANEREREHGDNRQGHSRLSPPTASYPKDEEAHTLESRHREGFKFLYKRTDTHWGYRPSPERPGYEEWTELPYEKRASCTIYPEDRFILAIDTTDREQMEAFLRDRLQRHHYLDMFPLLSRAIAFKRAEEETEGPFHDLLRGELMKQGVSADDADRAIPDLTRWWKLKNKEHRALVGTDDAKALREIVAEYLKRKRLDETATSPELLEMMQREHPHALLIARRPDGFHVVLDPEMPDEDVWVCQTVYTKTGKVRKADTRSWALVPRTVPSWRIFYEGPRWKDWNRRASRSEHLTGPEIVEAAERAYDLRTTDDKDADRVETTGIIAITYEWEDQRIEIWEAEKITVPRRPSVGYRGESMEWRRHDYRWRRDGSTVKVRRHQGWYDATSVSGREPWRPDREEPDHFAGLRRTKRTPATRVVITEDADLIRRTYRRHEQAEQMQEASRALRNIYDRITMNVIEDMEAARLQQAHDAFMAEYGDETLWEGHRKTLKESDLKFYPRDVDYPWLEQLIDDEVDLTGKTFAEAAALAGVEAESEDWLREWGHLKIDSSKREEHWYEEEDFEDDDDD